MFGFAVWLIYQNISWSDEVRLESPSGAEAVTLSGSIQGDWRARPMAFVTSAGDEGLSVLAGEQLSVREAVLAGPDGRVIASTGPPGEGMAVSMIDVRPGLATTVRGVEASKVGIAFCLLALATLTVATRWWRLLIVHDCPTRWRDAVRFTYVGLFFNVVGPGFNGGDVARAVAVVQRHPARRPEALMSVVVDRVLGLVSMVVIGACFVLTSDDRATDLKLPVSAAAAGLLVGGAVFCSHRIRGWIRFEALMARLPMGDRLERMDRSARLVVGRPGELAGALALSSMNHLLTGAAVSFIAAGLGSELGFGEWMSTTAIANTISGLPIAPGGLVVGEHLFGALAAIFGSTYAMGVATSLIFRVGLYGLSLTGGLVLLIPDGSRAGAADSRS
ncbi:flippase-like domain-containing protein [Planctomycetota bacterium]|nr:flippase-like domain-containing protein [Planctomycetota bacterium]